MIKKKTGLILENLGEIKRKEWYNQRFDACLNLCWMISEAELLAEKRKMKGGNFTSHFGIFRDHRLDWYIDYKDMDRVTKLFLRRAKTETNLSQKLISAWEADNKGFFRFLKIIDRQDLKQLSTTALSSLFEDFSGVYLKTITSSSLIDGFALGSDEIIQAEVNKLLDRHKIETKREEIFSILTAPIHQSFINQAEISLLKIALAAAGKSRAGLKLVKVFQETNIKAALVRHQQAFFWTKNNYHDNHILTVKHFQDELKAILQSRVDIKAEIKKIQSAPSQNHLKKRKLMNRLKPNHYLVNLLKISEDFTYWQDERKRRTFLYTHYASWLLQELGRRFGYSLEQMKYLTRAEIGELAGGKRFAPLELEARAKLSLAYQKGQYYEIKSGASAQKIIDSIFKSQDHSGISDFRGLTASTGKARGRAKLIMSAKEVDKIQPGDILVAVMTRPDYIAGLKKAAAIVTDEGGITCHAAIISRELGVPCIIGTKIATKVLKDGDLIEVNANHGWVRKVK